MRHRFICQVRWADLDLLGHVNNVRFVDYLQDARRDLLLHNPSAPTMHPAEGIVVVSYEVGYVAPMPFRAKPVIVETWVTNIRGASFTMAHEVFDEDLDGNSTVYLRASTLLTPYRLDEQRVRPLTPEEKAFLEQYVDDGVGLRAPRPYDVRRDPEFHYPIHVRFSDIDINRHVNNVRYFEYFQEARIAMFRALGRRLPERTSVKLVVAQAHVDYASQMTLRAEPYDCWTQVAQVGNRSLSVESAITDGDQTLARARIALVFFDAETQRSAEPPAAYREVLLDVMNA